MANVVSIGKLGEEQLAALAQAGVEVEESVDIDELDLGELRNDERFMFHLEPEEAAIFVEMKRVAKQVEKMEREGLGRTFMNLGRKISDSVPGEDLSHSEVLNPLTFENEDQEMEYWRLVRRKEFLSNLLWWRVGERGNCHHWHICIRAPAYGEKQLRVARVKQRFAEA